mmetsp:Transcript_2244/g.3426  ORF Transcript_2244/g.3426 Transcript_2244/m.3426 type:complete len:98 (-) Transcript_2244:245-538(-)
MTYRSRGRSIFEVIVAVCFVGFLVGFITVLCIGNYFRAKRAQERQRQRRIAKIAQQNSNNGRSSSQGGYSASVAGDTTVSGYEAPHVPAGSRNGVSA